ATDSIKRAAAAAKFKGRSRSTLEILAPAGLKADCLLVVGTGAAGKLKDDDFINLGGIAAGKAKAGEVTLIAELPGGAMKPGQAAAIASGLRLRAYRFDRYKTKKKDADEGGANWNVAIAVGDPAAAKKAYAPLDDIADG